jgi:hypothetical protein
MTATVYIESSIPSFHREARTEPRMMIAPRDWTRERSTTSGERQWFRERLSERHGPKAAANRAKHKVTCEEAKSRSVIARAHHR